MTRPRIAFIGRVAHEKTCSDQFLVNMLSEIADVKVFRHDAMSAADLIQGVNSFKPQQTVFFQLQPSISKHLLPLKNKNFVWVPMWDGFKRPNLRKRMLFRYYRVRILCFSRRVFDYAVTISQDVLHAQYYPRPKTAAKTCRGSPPYTFFLWQRTPQLGPDEIVRIIGRKNISKIILKSDIETAAPESIELQRLPAWLPEEEYQAIFNHIDYYVAPRFKEGIGFSFLEALAQGVPLIGHDEATMNEYVQDGQTSLLFDDRFQLLSGLVSPAQLRPALIEHMQQGCLQWMKAVPSVQSFILGKSCRASAHGSQPSPAICK